MRKQFFSRSRPVFSLLFCLMIGGGAAGAPSPVCLWSPSWLPRTAPSGVASIQYLSLNGGGIMDDQTAQTVAMALGPDRTLHFQYETDWPDDHVFPNGLSMGQIHQWLTSMIDDWNREPLMPLQLSLDRGNPGTGNVIRLDDTSSETSPNAGFGGFSWKSDGTTTTYSSRAVLNVGPDSLNSRELLEFLAKHELGHCLALAHSSNRAAAMGYQNGMPDYWARVGHYATDDLLGLRAVWARDAPGFGALEGHLEYSDGTGVGGGDVVAVDETSGEVLAGNVSDGQDNGRFRIELPAGRMVRLIAHPLHADASLFGEHFLPMALLTPAGFEPTEAKNGDQPAVFTIPDGSTMQIDPIMVDAPADSPLLNKDAPVVAMLPGERAHVAMHFDGLSSDAPKVTASLNGMTLANVTQSKDTVEFDATAGSDIAGASTVEVHSGMASNLQVGTLWVRPMAGLVLAKHVEPQLLVAGGPTEVAVTGYGLDQVTGARVLSETGSDELQTQLEGSASGGGIRLKISVPAGTADGPWVIRLQTARGDVPQRPGTDPRLWVGTGRVQTDPSLDLGDVPVGQAVPLTVQLTNQSSAPYTLTSFLWTLYQGGLSIDKSVTVWPVDPGASSTLSLNVTPTQLGPTYVIFGWKEGGKLDAVTEVRLWGVPAAGGN